MLKKILYILIIFLALGIAVFYFRLKPSWLGWADNNLNNQATEDKTPPDRKQNIEITANSTYSELMAAAGVNAALANEIYNVALPQCDLAKIRAGHTIELVYDQDSDNLKELIYNIDSEDELAVKNITYFPECVATSTAEVTSTGEASDNWAAEVAPIKYDVKIVSKGGEVRSSMYEAALENNIDERAIIALADAFQWTIDFAMDPRAGDKFQLVYEERYLNGQYIMPGKILAGRYVNDGQKYEVYYFEESADNSGYFDENGNSVQKMFLKAPVAYKYISSGFTTGLRYVEAFNVSTGHRAVDYAAPYGAPIRAVGDGTVIFAAYNGAYGNMVKIRHNGTYQTNYGHMSKFAVKKGDKVKQGDVIGYVGSTGFSTGPHVHFEMEKNGVKINPLKEILPPGQAIKDENKDRFYSEIKQWQAMLGE